MYKENIPFKAFKQIDPKQPTQTLVNGRTKGSKKDASVREINKLVKIAENRFKETTCYAINAQVSNTVVQLRTNDLHLAHFWYLNWLRPKKNAKADIIIRAATGIEEQNPYAWYNSKTKQAVFLNTNYYGQCKSWTLGAVADREEISCKVAGRKKGCETHSIHGACIKIKDEGVIIIAPTGTGKSTTVFMLLQAFKEAKFHSDDWIYVNYNKEAIGMISELQFYIRTDLVKAFPKTRKMLDKYPVENVEIRKGKRDYTGTPNSRAMIDPRKHFKVCVGTKDEKTKLTKIFLLRRDKSSFPEVKLTEDQAIKILRKGAYMVMPGAGPKENWGKIKHEAWYNPYLLVRTPARAKLQEKYFREMVQRADCYIFNTGVQTVHQSLQRYKAILTGKERKYVKHKGYMVLEKDLRDQRWKK